MSRKLRGKCKFQLAWTKKFPWCCEVENNQYAAYCKVCKSSLNIDSMGRQALISHQKGMKHKDNLTSSTCSQRINSIFLKESASSSCSTSQAQTHPITALSSLMKQTSSTDPICNPANSIPFEQACSSSTLKQSQLVQFKDSVTRAEILWCFNLVLNHSSLRGAANSLETIKLIAPGCEIIQKMQLQKSKIGYTIAYGLSPFLQNCLKKKLDESVKFVVSFDESMNKVAQKQQMDIYVRYWDIEKEEVSSRYLTSVFLRHCTAEDLLDGLKSGLSDTDLKKILQISMDGPNVNKKLLRRMQEDVKQHCVDAPSMLIIGSCGLHTIHNAFKSGMNETGWSIVPFLRALYNLFKNVPARRGLYTDITGSDEFPKKFGATRWLENREVAAQALKILPHLEKYIETIESDKKKKKPDSYSYDLVTKSVRDKLLEAKLTFFFSMASELEPFLRRFQTDAPLAPCLYQELSVMLKNNMERVIKKEVIAKSTNLCKVDTTKKENQVNVREVNIGFATRKAIGRALKQKSVKEMDVLIFQENCRKYFLKFINKIIESSPLCYPLTKGLQCLNPVGLGKDESYSNLSSTLQILVDSNQMPGWKADSVEREFKELCSSSVCQNDVKLYSQDKRIDHFWVRLLADKPNLSNLKEFVQMVLIISHGNSSVERGFSVNKECMMENQKERSLISQRVIYDHVKSIGGIERVIIDKPMLNSARIAHSLYKEALDEERRKDFEKKKEFERKKCAEAMARQLEEKKRKLMEETDREVAAIDEEVKKLRHK